MRRGAVIGAAAALAALALPGAAAAAPAPSLTEVSGVRFPARAYALTLPAPQTLKAGDVSVFEQGRPVRPFSLSPVTGGTAYRYGVVLAIDTSASMRGKPLRAAFTAARAFARHRRAGQPIAVIAFSSTVKVLQPFTADRARIDAVLRRGAPAGGHTHLLDAGAKAVALIRAARMTSGSVVLLTDGKDVGSRATRARVEQAAQAQGARFYPIGLASPDTDFGTLNLLAADTAGEFSSAASIEDLTRVYDRLGSRLASQYELRYRSGQPRGAHVRVQVQVEGRPATADYVAPRVPHRILPAFKRSPADVFWGSPAAMLLLGLLVAGLLVLAVLRLLKPRGRSARERLEAYVQPPLPEYVPGSAEDAAGGPRTSRLLSSAERSLGRWSRWGRFAEELEVARIETPPIRLAAGVAGGALMLLLGLPLITGAPVTALGGLLVPFFAWSVFSRKLRRQRSLFTDQLPDNLQVIASAMRAGHSFSGALAVVVDDAVEPTRRELQRVIDEERLGIPIETALDTVVRRMESKDLEQVALVAALQRETGGSTAEVLERVTQTVRDRLALRRMVQTLTAQGRMSRWIVSALPVALLGLITVINPAYVRPLYTTGLGQVLLLVAVVLITAGSLVIKRIVDIKV